jgi:thiol-disulfide isomerase/thioredoxin
MGNPLRRAWTWAWLVPAAWLALAAGPARQSAAADADAVTLKLVKYPEFIEAVKARRGKVVVIDVWATWCIPCMKEFPHLVELHKRYAKDGVACMSVNLDKAEHEAGALKFLRAKGAAFPNFLLDEKSEVWQEKWGLKGIPAVFVFGRDGKVAAKFHSDDDSKFTYEDVEKKVQELLGKDGAAKP